MSWLQNMQDKHPNWFNERLVNKNWLNLQAQPVYFELKEPGIMKK